MIDPKSLFRRRNDGEPVVEPDPMRYAQQLRDSGASIADIHVVMTELGWNLEDWFVSPETKKRTATKNWEKRVQSVLRNMRLKARGSKKEKRSAAASLKRQEKSWPNEYKEATAKFHKE